LQENVDKEKFPQYSFDEWIGFSKEIKAPRRKMSADNNISEKQVVMREMIKSEGAPSIGEDEAKEFYEELN
jgi:hypothetical protein